MITAIIAYLKADATLMALLSSSCAIQPNLITNNASYPYMVYRLMSDNGRTSGNVANSATIQFSIFAETFAAAEAISDRLKFLLDKDAEIGLSYSSGRIHSVWHSGGNTMFEQDTKLHHRVVMFNLLFVE